MIRFSGCESKRFDPPPCNVPQLRQALRSAACATVTNSVDDLMENLSGYAKMSPTVFKELIDLFPVKKECN
jgi:hypothetical protein